MGKGHHHRPSSRACVCVPVRVCRPAAVAARLSGPGKMSGDHGKELGCHKEPGRAKCPGYGYGGEGPQALNAHSQVRERPKREAAKMEQKGKGRDRRPTPSGSSCSMTDFPHAPSRPTQAKLQPVRWLCLWRSWTSVAHAGRCSQTCGRTGEQGSGPSKGDGDDGDGGSWAERGLGQGAWAFWLGPTRNNDGLGMKSFSQTEIGLLQTFTLASKSVSFQGWCGGSGSVLLTPTSPANPPSTTTGPFSITGSLPLV